MPAQVLGFKLIFVAGYFNKYLNVRILLLCAVFRRDCRWLHFDLNGFNVYWSLPQQNPFNLSPGVSWGGIKNQSKSTWCQSALIQFSINKTFQTALKMAHRKFMYLLNVTGREIIWQLFIWWQLWKKFLQQPFFIIGQKIELCAFVWLWGYLRLA